MNYKEEAEKIIGSFLNINPKMNYWEARKMALMHVTAITKLKVRWADEKFISDDNENGVKEKDTLKYWLKIKHMLE